MNGPAGEPVEKAISGRKALPDQHFLAQEPE
jgi:hypothetical protein